MAKKKSKHRLPPRRKRLKRPQRLESAKAWLETYQGNKIVRDYRRRYGVDWQTAFTELELLEVPIDAAYKQHVLQSEAARLALKRQKKAEIEANLRARLGFDQDEQFAFIVGYTSGGAPYGLTWEEWADIEEAEAFETFLDEDTEQSMENSGEL
jgi:hypothetical protein